MMITNLRMKFLKKKNQRSGPCKKKLDFEQVYIIEIHTFFQQISLFLKDFWAFFMEIFFFSGLTEKEREISHNAILSQQTMNNSQDDIDEEDGPSGNCEKKIFP